MSKKLTTYGELGTILTDIDKQLRDSPAFDLFNREKINRFRQQNAMRINVYYEKRAKIFTKNIHADEQGNLKFVDTAEGNKLSREYDFISPEHKADFEESSKEFLSISFELFV